MASVQTPVIPIVSELIRNSPGTISLGQGVVNYGPPNTVTATIERFFNDPNNRLYQPVQGIRALRELLTEKLQNENGILLDNTNRLVVTAGSNMGFMNAVFTITDPGEEVILLTPYYFNHEMAIAIADAKAVCVPTDALFQPQPEAIISAITARTRAIVTISPNNPTGAVYSEEALRTINSICRDYSLYHIHDEAYEYFTYNGAKHFSPGSIAGSAEYTISLFSLSKAYGFAGWRVGYMVLPEHLYLGVKKVQDTNLICAPVISQWAAVGALGAGADYCRKHIEKLSEVRRAVLERLNTVRDLITVVPTQGAFYFFIRINADVDMMALTERLIREFKVAVIPGATFGVRVGCFLRISYGALDPQTVSDGINRLVRGLHAIVGK